MKKITFLLLIILLFSNCSREYKILEIIDPAKEDYKLYIIPTNTTITDSVLYKYNVLQNRSVLIDDQKILHLMKNEWILAESAVPKEKHVKYRLILYDNKEHRFTAWLDDKFKILIWEDKLLAFDDSLLFKYKDSFKYLPEYDLCVNEVEAARKFKVSIANAGGLIANNSKNKPYWDKYDGKYILRRPKNDLKPSRKIGKLRKRIKDDFLNADFYLIGLKFDSDTDSITVSISSDSIFYKDIPESYYISGSFVKYDSIKFRCTGLEKTEIQQIAFRNNIRLVGINESTN